MLSYIRSYPTRHTTHIYSHYTKIPTTLCTHTDGQTYRVSTHIEMRYNVGIDVQSVRACKVKWQGCGEFKLKRTNMFNHVFVLLDGRGGPFRKWLSECRSWILPLTKSSEFYTAESLKYSWWTYLCTLFVQFHNIDPLLVPSLENLISKHLLFI